MVVTCSSIGEQQEAGGRTVYVISVAENGQEWEVRRHYSDFLSLDEALKSSSLARLEELPEKGLFGLRHWLNLGDFNEQRRLGLHKYLECATSQIDSLSQLPALSDFLAQSSSARSSSASGLQDVSALVKPAEEPSGSVTPPAAAPPSGDTVPLTGAGFHAVLHQSGHRELEAFTRRLVEAEGLLVTREAGFRSFVTGHSVKKELQTFEGLKKDLRSAAKEEEWLQARAPERRPSAPAAPSAAQALAVPAPSPVLRTSLTPPPRVVRAGFTPTRGRSGTPTRAATTTVTTSSSSAAPASAATDQRTLTPPRVVRAGFVTPTRTVVRTATPPRTTGTMAVTVTVMGAQRTSVPVKVSVPSAAPQTSAPTAAAAAARTTTVTYTAPSTAVRTAAAPAAGGSQPGSFRSLSPCPARVVVQPARA